MDLNKKRWLFIIIALGITGIIIFANILANPLCRLAKDMAKFCQQNGLIILSGILNRQANRVEHYYFSNGFSRVFVQKLGEWTTIIMRRR